MILKHCAQQMDKDLSTTDWSLHLDYDYNKCPWKSYIPTCDPCVLRGTQCWIFRMIYEDSLLDPTSLGIYQLKPHFIAIIKLIYWAIHLICKTVEHLSRLSMPTEICLPLVVWIRQDYAEKSKLLQLVWHSQWAILEMYGWATYRLLHDVLVSRDWWRPFNASFPYHLGRVVHLWIKV